MDAPLAPATNAALAGRSLFFDGTRADGTFFIVYADMTGTLKLRATANQTWQGMDTPPQFFWALRPRRWLLKSELDGADTTPDATHTRAVVIDANRHPALFLAIRSRLAGLRPRGESRAPYFTVASAGRTDSIGIRSARRMSP
jgi:hypothetical protein